jgi:glycosyltransferase involved in cell wall biosynthesis
MSGINHRTLYYFPLESYRERYTMQLSAAKTGWLERNWIKYGVDYYRILSCHDEERNQGGIKHGVALDPTRRSRHCLDQVRYFLSMLESGEIQNNSVLYLDDFWTPGIEAIQYCADQMGISLRMFSNLWAQSVDEFDFTYKMRNWIRHYEKGNAKIMEGIFVANTMLKDLLVFNGVADEDQVYVVGHPWDTEEVFYRMPIDYRYFILSEDDPIQHDWERQDTVIWSSRWDLEKRPEFFLRVATEVIEKNPKIKFVICTSAPKLRSNDKSLLGVLKACMEAFPDNIILKENLTKEEYYEILTKSKIQFNAADQDWISYTLLESSVAGCYPLYPYWRGFPETFEHNMEFMYAKNDVEDAVKSILNIIEDKSLWTGEAIQKRSWIHKRYDGTWIRMLNVMGIEGRERLLPLRPRCPYPAR